MQYVAFYHRQLESKIVDAGLHMYTSFDMGHADYDNRHLVFHPPYYHASVSTAQCSYDYRYTTTIASDIIILTPPADTHITH